MSVKKENLSAWNLTIFAQPRHPMFENRKVVQQLNCNFLNLDFNTVAEKDQFAKKFKMALNLRDDAAMDFDKIVSVATLLSEKMGDVSKVKKNVLMKPSRKGSMFSFKSTKTVSQGPPKLRPISSFSSLGLDHASEKLFG
jgi:hypothetical protein